MGRKTMSKIKILIVEDEQLMALDLKEKLEEMEFIVTGITVTGEQTIEQVRLTQPDLVLMDIVIEGNIDGIETADRVRRMFNIPVIYLTAFTDSETMNRAKASEPFAYLVKPYNEWELKFLIEIATYKNQLEKSLSESEKSYRNLAENLPAIVYRTYIRRTAAQGGKQVEFFNELLRELTGYNDDELQFTDVCALASLIIPEDRQKVIAALEKAIEETRSFEVDYRASHKDGTIKYFHERGKVVLDKEGNPYFIEGVIFDISGRKRTEAALQKERDRAQRYLDIAGVMMVAISSKHEVELINREGCEILGYGEAEIIGKNWFDNFIPKKDIDTVKEVFDRLLSGEVGLYKYFENPVLCKHGEEKIIAWYNTILYDEHGQISGTLSSGQEITVRKKMEAEMQKTERLESLGLLAGGIAHDFNNILAAILVNISLAKMHSEDNQKALERLAEAEKAINRAQNLTQQLLTFSKGGAPIKSLSAIQDILKDTAEFALSGSNARAKFTVQDNLNHVAIDRGQISQVIQNLIINAEQAMPDGGVIRISAENVTLAEDTKPPLKQGKYVKITVKDSGIGIPPEHLHKIFDPFFSTKQKGSGLGLSTAYSIIRNHNGSIAVESELGKGSVFSVYLPAAENEVVKKTKTKQKIVPGRGKILLMDDEEMILEATGQLLHNIGYSVDKARNGNEAVKLYEAAQKSGQPYAAAILDLVVPGGMGGKETVRLLRQIDPQVKAIVSSGYSTDSIMADFSEYGFAAAVSKPYKPEELSAVLQRVIGAAASGASEGKDE